MSRPRSLLGLLARVVSLGAQRRPWLATGLAATAAVLVARGGCAARPTPVGIPGVQAAVLADGFVAAATASEATAVAELELDGDRRRDTRVVGPAPLRIVGTLGGPAAAWLDGRKIWLALVMPDGALDQPSRWGTAAMAMCDGVASDPRRFGVGWREVDGSVWMVHGTLTRPPAAVQVVPPTPIAAQRAEWCGIASAGDDIALFWRDGGRVAVVRCTASDCTGRTTWITLPSPETILAIGATRDDIAIATRGADGQAALRWFDRVGAPRALTPLATAPGRGVTLTSAGRGALALGSASDAGAFVLRVTPGAAASVWESADHADAPALAWTSDRLAVVSAQDGELAATVVDVPATGD